MIEDQLNEIIDRLKAIEEKLTGESLLRGAGRPRESLTLAIQALDVNGQLLLPFGKRTATTAHTRAARLGMKISTRTVIRQGQQFIQLRRVA